MNSDHYRRKCCICRKPIEGYGHSPIPVWFSGRCCDKCHSTYVLPARMMMLAKESKEEQESADQL